jgi:FkbM family methyltransferase
MMEFSEALRYEYPELTPDSFVIDAGGYEGNWAAEIHRKYGCRILIFEPIKAFADRIKERFKDVPAMGVKHGGLGGADCAAGKMVEFHVQNDSTGQFAGSPNVEMVELFNAGYVIRGLECDIDLLKLNVEGAEFEILWSLLDSGLIKKVKNLQVQFHAVIPNAGDHRATIQKRLSETHECMYDAPFVWEGWRLK